MKRLRIGVCGTAFWAETVHLPALARAAGFELTAVFGRNAGRTKELAGKFSIQGFQDFDRFVDSVEAVSFVVPPSVQAELAPRAIRARRHVILEKPVAMTVAGAETIANAVRETGVGAVCFLTRKFIPVVQEFIEKARKAGVTGAEVHFLASALTPGSPYAGSQWRQERNGALWDVGPHLLTNLTGLLGDVETVSVQHAEDGSLIGRLNHTNGRESSFLLNLRMPLGPLQEALIVKTEAGERRLEGFQYDRVETFERAAAMLLRAIAGDGQPRAAFADAVRLVHILAAAERSIEASGEPVPVPSAA